MEAQGVLCRHPLITIFYCDGGILRTYRMADIGQFLLAEVGSYALGVGLYLDLYLIC